jgi:hypothetical protein
MAARVEVSARRLPTAVRHAQGFLRKNLDVGIPDPVGWVLCGPQVPFLQIEGHKVTCLLVPRETPVVEDYDDPVTSGRFLASAICFSLLM